MDKFLIDVTFDESYNSYIAMYSTGANVVLNASNYHDACLEADLLDDEINNYELGYN